MTLDSSVLRFGWFLSGVSREDALEEETLKQQKKKKNYICDVEGLQQ